MVKYGIHWGLLGQKLDKISDFIKLIFEKHTITI